ncbi:MAG: secondary thiamine-phosphate synthase enzyme YjbQ [Alphaproteobacteria bacterium]|jgi:secondary thiamine-phosphate synthase enzyme|nr:secondary thiamine-phosphate synthase enzyme YjbQ [Alphaproteobacteria bacterium]|tara:strand:+ start:1157 stop:1576 length:420 start_codon:yes stop_codon:yes gene_type:complete
MKQASCRLSVCTSGRGLVEITGDISGWILEQSMENGLLTVFCQHTSASLVIQENADPSVLLDLNDFFERVVDDDPSLYRHRAEGADDMPAHIRSALTQSQLSIPVTSGRMVLGTWQGIYIFEHRTRSHERTLALHLVGA